MKGIVFDIQYNCIYDGPGIRTVVFFKGCPLRCAWCHNPESLLLKPEMSYFAEKCACCGDCVEACPNRALHLSKDRMVRNVEKCIVCGLCADVCPNGATEKIGREMAVAEIVQKVERDKMFYDNSNGGATFSGGEPTMQPDFLIETLSATREAGIHTALETCGHFKMERIGNLVGLVDLFLFDIKHADPTVHKKYTGVSNKKILANFKEILSHAGNERVIPRIPLIPGANTGEKAIQQIIALLKNAGYAGPLHLMPYNSMSRTKWEKVGRGHEYADMGKQSEEDIKRAA